MAEKNDNGTWLAEQIPEKDWLYMGIHKNLLTPDGNVPPGAFRNHANGMSTDWSRYSTPTQTRERRRTPSDNLVVQMVVGVVRAIPGQLVEHTPLPENRAHTDVSGEKTVEARVLLRRSATIVLPLSV